MLYLKSGMTLFFSIVLIFSSHKGYFSGWRFVDIPALYPKDETWRTLLQVSDFLAFVCFVGIGVPLVVTFLEQTKKNEIFFENIDEGWSKIVYGIALLSSYYCLFRLIMWIVTYLIV